MKSSLLLFLTAFSFSASLRAQKLSCYFQPIFQGDLLKLEEGFHDANGDSLSFHTFRFYVGNVTLLKNEHVVYQENRHFLLDLEDESTLMLSFDLPPKAVFNAIQFELGVDSLTNVSGATGGDLDPTKGMFWTWQSGYINCKMEGYYAKCPTRNHEFQFHLGGYLPPFQSVQKVLLPAPTGKSFQVQMDVSSFFAHLDWATQSSIMSPSKEAVELSKALAASFKIHR